MQLQIVLIPIHLILLLTPATSWSNVPADFNLHISDGDSVTNDTNTSGEVSITLTNGSGNTTISCQQPSTGDGGQGRLQVRAEQVQVCHGSFGNSVTLSAATTYF